MKIVKVKKGQYIIQAFWFFGWHYWSMACNFTWRMYPDTIGYCLGTHSKAVQRVEELKKLNGMFIFWRF